MLDLTGQNLQPPHEIASVVLSASVSSLARYIIYARNFFCPFCTAFAINDINLQYVLPRLTQDLPSFECCFAQEIIMVLKDCDIFASAWRGNRTTFYRWICSARCKILTMKNADPRVNYITCNSLRCHAISLGLQPQHRMRESATVITIHLED